jgi:hypothetical protein
MDAGRGKSDAEALLAQLLPFAEKMLREHGEFLPFGGRLNSDGEIVWEGASDGQEHPHSQDLLTLLRDEHSKLAGSGKIKASAILYDVRIVPPGCISKRDAVAIELDHRDGYSAIVYYPYRIEPESALHVEPPFAQQGENQTFGGGSPNTSLERTRDG